MEKMKPEMQGGWQRVWFRLPVPNVAYKKMLAVPLQDAEDGRLLTDYLAHMWGGGGKTKQRPRQL
jgi:hypothetical protein